MAVDVDQREAARVLGLGRAEQPPDGRMDESGIVVERVSVRLLRSSGDGS